MTSEVLCNRWTTLVVRELLCGSTRFNDLRRGLPRMSPSLLSKRLKQLEKAGIVKTIRNDANIVEYHLSEAGEELRPLIIGMGNWGQRWVQSELSMRNLDPSLLMWDMRRNLRPEPMPPSRCTIQFTYPELPNTTRHWWMIVEKSDETMPVEADCLVHPDQKLIGKRKVEGHRHVVCRDHRQHDQKEPRHQDRDTAKLVKPVPASKHAHAGQRQRQNEDRRETSIVDCNLGEGQREQHGGPKCCEACKKPDLDIVQITCGHQPDPVVPVGLRS